MQRVLGRIKPIVAFITSTLAEFNDDHVPRMAAALSYYALFSAAPLLIIIVGVAGILIGRDAAQQQVLLQLRAIVGDQLAEFIHDLAAQMPKPSTGLIATLVGAGTLFIGAYGVLNALQAIFHTIWDVRPPSINNRVAFLVARIWPLVLVVVGLLMITLLVVFNLVVDAANNLFGINLIGSGALEALLSDAGFIAIFFVTFALTYRFLPPVRLAWRDVWIGALVSAVLFGLGRFVLDWYLTTFGIGSIFGAAASFVVFLVWIYYSAHIFLIGAEMTQVYARTRGSRRHEQALLEQAGAQRPMFRWDRMPEQ